MRSQLRWQQHLTFGRLAQRSGGGLLIRFRLVQLQYLPPNQGVAGSSPAERTISFFFSPIQNYMMILYRAFFIQLINFIKEKYIFKSKNVCLIISVALAILCLIIMIVALGTGSQGLNSSDGTEVAGTALGMAIVMPCVVVGGIGTVLHTIGGCVYKRGLVLAGLICECASIIFMFLWGMYYIPAIVLGFIGYAKMPKKV